MATYLKEIDTEDKLRVLTTNGEWYMKEIEFNNKSDDLTTLDVHNRELSKLISELKTNEKTGLKEEEANEILAEKGPNVLKDPGQGSFVGAIIGEFFGMFQLLFWIAGTFSFLRYYLGNQYDKDVNTINILLY